VRLAPQPTCRTAGSGSGSRSAACAFRVGTRGHPVCGTSDGRRAAGSGSSYPVGGAALRYRVLNTSGPGNSPGSLGGYALFNPVFGVGHGRPCH
jgi:hypothetical protein